MATTVMTTQAAGIQQHVSDYRVVVLGHRGSGKTSVINCILDTDDGSGVSSSTASARGTLQSLRRQGKEAGGRSLTLVEAPGWWKNHLVKDTPEVARREIASSSIAMCPPGPHAFLLVVQLSSPFPEKHRRSTEEHVELLLGERAWRHTVVLFTYNDHLEFDVMDRHMGSAREARHHWLVQRCRGRCHVFNVDKRSDSGTATRRGSSAQVTELLEMIEDVVAGNGGRHYGEREPKPPFWDSLTVGETLPAVEGGREGPTGGQEPQEDSRPGWRPCLPKLRIVLLGYRRSGKSSAGNAILGQRCFETGRRTTRSVCRQGQAEPTQQQRPQQISQGVCRQGQARPQQQKQRLTVVDTPGWWRGVSVFDTSEMTKQEILLSASLCPPGPHALLLVHRVDFSFGEEELRAPEEHLELLGEDVWSHAMVLFTFGDWLGATSIEQYIRAEGKALQSLLEKCGQRYHVLGNSNSSGTQVLSLLEKIEAMAGQEGGHFELDRKRLKRLKKSKMAAMRRSTRRANQQRQRESVKSFKGPGLLATLRILLLGYSQSGKTSLGNTLLGPEVFDLKPTALCEWHHRSVAGQRFTVVDTPGWQKSTLPAGTPSCTMDEMALAVSLCHPGPHAVLLVIRADASFGADEGRAAQEHLELILGEQVWRHTLVLFTCGDGLGGDGASIQQYIESEGETLRGILEKCGNRYHVLDNKTNRMSGANALVLQLLEKVKEMVALNSGGHLDLGNPQSDGVGGGRGVEGNTDRGSGKHMLDGKWMELDDSERPRCLGEGRLHRLSRSSRGSYSAVPREEDTGHTIRPDGFQKVSEEDQSDDVFLDRSPVRSDVPLFSLFVPLTPIPSAEHSLASSSTSISKLV